MKLFEEIYNKSLQEAGKPDFMKQYEKERREQAKAERTLDNGWEIKFKVSEGTGTKEGKYWDLHMKHPQFGEYRIPEFCHYESAYSNPGMFGGRSEQGYYLKTLIGGAGNGEGRHSCETPRVNSTRYLKDRLTELTNGFNETTDVFLEVQDQIEEVD
jgi:hypothetical protein